MKKIAVIITLSILILAGCADENLPDEAYEEMGNNLANLLMKYEQDELNESEDNKDNSSLDDSAIVEDETKEEKNNETELAIENDFKIETLEIKQLETLKEISDKEVYAYIDANEGMDFVTIHLNIQNISDGTIPFGRWTESNQIKLIINDMYLYTPFKTLMDLDFTSIEQDIDVGESIEGYYAFLIPENVLIEVESTKLFISNENDSRVFNVENNVW
ncbi:MAG: hypothetical protein ACLFMO_04930 [Eubacteriales bacterium]